MAGITKVINNHYNTNNNEVSREDIQAAIAKAVELRALHAALVQQGNSPASLRSPLASPFSHHASHLSAHDYPVFTPSYEAEPLSGYQHIRLENPNFPENWDEYNLGGNGLGPIHSDYNIINESSRKGFPSPLTNLDPHICPLEDQKSVTGLSKYRRHSLGDFRSASSCNKCKPAVISSEVDTTCKNGKYSNIVVVPLTDSHSSAQSQPRTRGLNFSWLFPKLKKKNKNENSPNRTESDNVSQIFNHLGMMSTEALKKELIEANESRDVALMEIKAMKSSIGELKQKLESLETYCEELKNSLRLDVAMQEKDSQFLEKLGDHANRVDHLMPVSEEVMVEGFLQIVSEARLSVKQLCKTLIGQIEETDNTLMDNINSLLMPHKLSLNSKYSKAVLYHLEAIINQSLYQDFENSVFQKNGSPQLLDPQRDRQANFSSYVSLRNLSWNEVLRKGTKYYSQEFSKFCDQKMSCIITTLNWTRPWPEQLLQSFFVAAKCMWLLHLLAFSFVPPLGILRVQDNSSFDPHYMEDMFMDRQNYQAPSQVKIMVVPGFYVQERVLKCKVLCRTIYGGIKERHLPRESTRSNTLRQHKPKDILGLTSS